MQSATNKDAIETITTHYIDGAFVESHGREVMDVIRPTNGQVIARVTLADEEDTRRAIAAAKRAFATYGRSTKEERLRILRRLHEAVAAHIGDLTDAMVEEYGGPAVFCRIIMEAGANVFLSAEKALQELPLTRSWGKTTVTLEPPMVSQKQYERVQSYIRKGIEEGAEVLVGGEGHPEGLEAGYFVKPTVFVNVKNDTTIAKEEIFGPVLCVIAYDNDEDAIRIANDSKYRSSRRRHRDRRTPARRVASQIRAGRVAINGMTGRSAGAVGRIKNSGVGREYGTYGIEAFLEPRAILEA